MVTGRGVGLHRANSATIDNDSNSDVVAGPVVGIGYSIGISILDGKINKKESKDPEFDHDLFYGNCEQML